MPPRSIILLVLIPGFAAIARGDDFDRLEGANLNAAIRSESGTTREALSVAELGNLPRVLTGIRSGLVLVKTSEGNPARLLVVGALRRPAAPSGEGAAMKKDEAEPALAPILVLERFDAFDAGPATTRLAHGRDLMLFDGYQFDLDTGQVVPDGHGGDLRFVAKDGGRLEAIGGAKLITLKAPPTFANVPGAPSTGKAILAADFAGRYRLAANGQWSGVLDLNVGDRGVVTGRFRSDQTGNSYRVTGQVVADAPNQIRFDIQYPRSRQEYDGRLWAESKGAMAGTLTLLDNTYGFVAVREGGKLAPEGVESAPALDTEPTLSMTLDAEGKVHLGERQLEPSAFAENFAELKKEHPDALIRVRADKEASVDAVSRVLRALDAAGFDSIWLGPLK